MRLTLKGHNERYPVEQLQMQLFPDVQAADAPFSEKNGAISTLSRGTIWLTATAAIEWNGRRGFASRRLRIADADVRRIRRILQQSYYLAAVQVLDKLPPWGALSGVRPSKLSTKRLLEGGTRRQADRMLQNVYFVSEKRRSLCLDASEHTVAAAELLEPTDLSLYIGIPFCPTRCAYCSFVSQSIERAGSLLPQYLDALETEIRHTGRLLRESGYQIRTLYMGGGTPTTLNSAQMGRLLDTIRENFDLSRCLEFTVEGGRPDTLDEEKLRVIKNGGCTRISINPQTMSDEVLRIIGRRHTGEQTLQAYAAAERAGFTDINMDLIAGLPGDTVEGFAASVKALLDLSPSNITVHTLALKKGAALFYSGTTLPDAAAVETMLDEAASALRQAGYAPYYLYRQKYMSGSFENVGWCREGYSGLYNIYMMEELHSILSVGGGGMNKINLPGGQLERFHNPKDPKEYIESIGRILQQKDEMFEILRSLRQ